MSTRDLVRQTTTGGTWRSRAACMRADPEIFFPEQGRSDAAAKAVCRTCPVTAPCLIDALTHNMRGVWGGTSEHERRPVSGVSEQ